jgi:hypothetical protein
LLQEKNRAIREAFFRAENTELLRAQAGHLEKILHELMQRVPVPARGELRMTPDGVRVGNGYPWTEERMLVEVQFCYRLQNVGPKSIAKWHIGGELSLSDDTLGKRFVTKEEFPRIGSRDDHRIGTDSTILPTTWQTTEHIVGVIVRRSEKFDEILPRILNATSVTFWGITEDGPGDKTTVKLADVIDWTKLLPSFQQAYLLGLGRLPAE